MKLNCLYIDQLLLLLLRLSQDIIQVVFGKSKTYFHRPSSKQILENQITNFEIVVSKLFK